MMQTVLYNAYYMLHTQSALYSADCAVQRKLHALYNAHCTVYHRLNAITHIALYST